jgi:very-short-patch-repair endonuclease
MQERINKIIRSEKRQRALRNNPTDAEIKLWQYLRRRQVKGCKFRRQHPLGAFILDFVCLERKIVIELDGGQHLDAVAYDNKRTRFLEQAGFVVLRFWNNEVFENIEGVMAVILRTVDERATTSPPLPSPSKTKGRG